MTRCHTKTWRATSRSGGLLTLPAPLHHTSRGFRKRPLLTAFFTPEMGPAIRASCRYNSFICHKQSKETDLFWVYILQNSAENILNKINNHAGAWKTSLMITGVGLQMVSEGELFYRNDIKYWGRPACLFSFESSLITSLMDRKLTVNYAVGFEAMTPFFDLKLENCVEDFSEIRIKVGWKVLHVLSFILKR